MPWPDDPARLGRGDNRKETADEVAEQSGERRVTAKVGEELIRLMLPDMDPELVQLMLSRVARSAALRQEYMDLSALVRDAGIDLARLCAILGLNPETLPAGDGYPHPPVQ